MSYQYPSIPNVATLQQVSAPLRDGTINPVRYNVPDNKAIQNVNPNAYAPESTFVPPGTQSFGTGVSFDTMPQDQDIVHREIHVTIDQPLYYRGNLGTPRFESAATRLRTPAITTPQSKATFMNGNPRGDIYGG